MKTAIIFATSVSILTSCTTNTTKTTTKTTNPDSISVALEPTVVADSTITTIYTVTASETK